MTSISTKRMTGIPRRGGSPLDRLIYSLALGAWGAFIAYFSMKSHPAHLAKDFSYPWRAARALLDGLDPYQVIQATGAYPFNAGFFYPLPGAIIAIPFAPLPPHVAGALFVFVGSTLLAWGVIRTAPHRLWLFASAPFVQAAILGQWSPILTAAALTPALQFVLAGKPTTGFAAWAHNPTWRGVIGGLTVVAIAFAVQPTWLADWRAAMPSTTRYRGPALTLMGAFLFLGLARWRRREGRLFMALAIAPQLPVWYEQLMLWLIPSTRWRSLALTACSWVGYLLWYPDRMSPRQNEIAFPLMLFSIYAPALVLLLMLPSREEAPAAASSPAPGVSAAPDESAAAPSAP